MKLVFVGTSPNPRGTEQHMVTLAAAVAALGHEVHVFTQPGGFAWNALKDVVSVHAGRFRFPFDPVALFRLWRLVRTVRPDWVVAGMANEYFPALLVGRRVALFRHIDRKLSRFKTWCVKRFCDRFFVVSEAVKRTLGYGTVLYNPIRPMVLSASENTDARERLGIPLDAPVIGYAGALSVSKGVFALRDAVRDLDVHVIWAGGGKDEAELRATVGERHHFTTWQSDGRLVYAGMDILVVPSLALESASRVAAEAQLVGKVVCGSNVGGIPEMVCPEMRAHLAPGGDSVALARSLQTLLASDLTPLAQAGRSYAQRFVADTIAREFMARLSER